MTNLIVLAGVPGSGKSTWAKTMLDLKYSIVSSDAIRKKLAGSLKQAHQDGIKPWDAFYDDIEQKLDHNVDVVADATFLTKPHRIRALEVGWKHNAKVHLVLFKNVMEATIRNANREEDHRVPDHAMSGMMSLYYDTLAALPQEPWDSITKIES